MGSIVSKLFLDFWIFFIFTRSLSSKSANNNRANLPPVQIRRASDFPRINCFESVALTDA